MPDPTRRSEVAGPAAPGGQNGLHEADADAMARSPGPGPRRRDDGRVLTMRLSNRRDREPADTAGPLADRGGRALEIDAIRGWAALSVVCFHVFWETFGAAVPWLRNPYTAVLLAGHFDVIVFFILSGDALSFPFFHGGRTDYLQRAAFKRYPRLTVPIVVVTAVTALTMAAGLAPTLAASEIVGRTDWLGNFARFNAAGSSALKFAFFYVYVGGYRADYLPFLWTMPVELAGSFFLLLALFIVPRIRGGAWMVAVLAYLLVAAGSFIGCFFIGMLLGKARADGLFARLPRAFGRIVAPLGIAAALVFVGDRQVAGDQDLRALAGAGTVLLFCIYACRGLVALLSRSRVSQFLGRVSYLLYLWHFTVLITLTSGLITWSAGEDGLLAPDRAIAIGVLTVAVSVAVAHWTRGIEGWARDVNGLLLRWCWTERQHGAVRVTMAGSAADADREPA